MTPSATRRTLLLAAASASAATASLRIRRAAAQAPGRFAALEAEFGGRIGVSAVDTGTGARLNHRADERFPLCSTFKLLAVSAILTRSATDRGLLERTIGYTKQDLVPYSPITSQHAGAAMTVAAICAAALQYSDNTAANLMIRLLGGPGSVTAFARSIGDPQFRLDRWETALNDAVPGDPRDTSTPAAMMTDLRRAALGNLLGSPQRDQLVAWMRGCRTGLGRIRAAVPADWVVADKTGSGEYGTANDIAVAWPPGSAPVVLAVYSTQDKQDAPARDALVAAAAREALDVIGAGRA
jgi:beta-lactamase class A